MIRSYRSEDLAKHLNVHAADHAKHIPLGPVINDGLARKYLLQLCLCLLHDNASVSVHRITSS